MTDTDQLDPTPDSADRIGADRVARWITELFAPAVLATVMPIVVAVHASPTLWAAVGWSLTTTAFTAAVPFSIIWIGVRRGRLTDHHIGVREQRRTPLLVALASVIAGLFVLVLADAPRQLIAMVVVMLAVLAAIAVVNRIWKLSAHSAVSAGSVIVLTILYGPAALAFILLVAAIAWSRVRLADHTIAQVVAGVIVGATVAAPVFLAIG
jgi:hypothetical protein